MTDLEQIQELNRWPFTEQGVCLQCGAWYRLTQLKLPAGSDIEQGQAVFIGNDGKVYPCVGSSSG